MPTNTPILIVNLKIVALLLSSENTEHFFISHLTDTYGALAIFQGLC